jgi:hypothetical protein
MKEMQCTQDITVRSIFGSKGQTFRLDTPVPVRAGQRVYYGIRTDGTPVVSVVGETPIFDQVEIQRLDPLADVVGIAASDDVRPTLAGRLGLGRGGYDRHGSYDRDEEYRLIDALTEAAELIYRVLDATAASTRQITLPAEASSKFLIPLPR